MQTRFCPPNCPNLDLTEEAQNELKRKGKAWRGDHNCLKLKAKLYHGGHHDKLPRPPECRRLPRNHAE